MGQLGKVISINKKRDVIDVFADICSKVNSYEDIFTPDTNVFLVCFTYVSIVKNFSNPPDPNLSTIFSINKLLGVLSTTHEA